MIVVVVVDVGRIVVIVVGAVVVVGIAVVVVEVGRTVEVVIVVVVVGVGRTVVVVAVSVVDLKKRIQINFSRKRIAYRVLPINCHCTFESSFGIVPVS